MKDILRFRDLSTTLKYIVVVVAMSAIISLIQLAAVIGGFIYIIIG